MIILSNNLTAIMELEPRLLEIASPVYVMGECLVYKLLSFL